MKMPHGEQTIPYDAFIRIAEKLLASRMGVKSISGVAHGYRSEFIAAVNQVFRGNITPVALRDRLGTLIEDYAERIFIEGAVEAGSKITHDDLEKDELAAIDEWKNGQLAHVESFAAAADAAATPVEREAILSRVDLWVNALRNLGAQGRASVLANRPGTWHLGQTEEHCATCANLDGKRHRLKWYTDRNYFPRTPGAAMDCGGYRCDCQVTADDGTVLLP